MGRLRIVHLVALALVLACISPANQAQASSYAYSVEQTSGYNISGGTAGPFTLFSSDSATLPGGQSQAFGGSNDALQSYVGPAGGRPAENTFTAKGMTTPDYARGDALVTAPTLSTASVAEGFMADAGIATGSSAWSISAPLTLSVAGAVTLSFNYSNQFSLVNTTTPSGAVSADYNYTFSIKDSGGSIVFTSSPNAVNEALSLSSQGSNSPAGSGSISITSTTLTAGTYTMTLSGSSHVFINAVPEPSTDALLVSGAALIAGLALKLRRRSA